MHRRRFHAAASLPYLQFATWNDYNEGKEIETGIDSCYSSEDSFLSCLGRRLRFVGPGHRDRRRHPAKS
jgi:hypothetical protein